MCTLQPDISRGWSLATTTSGQCLGLRPRPLSQPCSPGGSPSRKRRSLARADRRALYYPNKNALLRPMKGAGPPQASPAGSKLSGAQAGEGRERRLPSAIKTVEGLSAPCKLNGQHMRRE